MLETDYTNYAIVYECSSNDPRLLNYRNDDIHIFTRGETVDAAVMTGYQDKAEQYLAGSKARLEVIEQKACLPKSWLSSIGTMFTDPEKFFRKW